MINNDFQLPKGNIDNKDKPAPFVRHDRTITLKANPVTFSETLGPYYIDMTAAIVHYTDHHYGQFDEKGVPMLGFGKYAKYYAITVAQYGFILHDLIIKNGKNQNMENVLYECLNWLESNKDENIKTACWRCNHHNERYDLKEGWVSAMAQGEIISFYLRMYQYTKKENLLETALKAYEFMKIDVKDGGIRTFDSNGNLWLEEFPSNPPSYVLNGFIYAIFGLYDLYRITKRKDVKNDIDDCILTLKNELHKYDVGYWSLYDQRTKELVQDYYQKNVHIPQMEVLYFLTKEDTFLYYKNKWEKTMNWMNLLFVNVMYRILPRWIKLKKCWKSLTNF